LNFGGGEHWLLSESDGTGYNASMKVLFLHGWQSTPGGLKPTYLRDHGHEVLNPALPEGDFDAAVCIVHGEYDEGQPDVVVVSSRGGAVAMNINSGLPSESLIEVGSEHRLADEKPLGMMERVVRATYARNASRRTWTA